MPATDELLAVVRDVEDFVSGGGWDQAPQLFALVPTAELLDAQPELGATLDRSVVLTPVAQEDLPDADLAETLAGIMWPDAVRGCALAQEIVVLPPDAEAALPAGDDEALRRAAAEHPLRREARLVAAVLRDGSAACVLRLRDEDELLTGPDLAPNLTEALLATLRP